MKRFSPREFALRDFALLCAPVLLVAGIGVFVSKRKAPAFDDSRLHLRFHLEKPTTLEAFRGVDAALITELHGPNTRYGANKDPLRVWQSDAFLEVQSARGLQKSRRNTATEPWHKVWIGSLNNSRWSLNTRAIPDGPLRFGLDAVISPGSSAPTTSPPRVSGVWRVNRAQIQPFSFAMPRSPLVKLKSVRILQVNSNGNIRGEAVFDLQGAAMGDQTRFDYEFHQRNGGMGSGYGNSDLTPQSPTRRVREWTVYRGFSVPGEKQMVRVSGRVSADERWPLAFEFEPFDFNAAKPQQQLKFKSWPVPTPKF